MNANPAAYRAIFTTYEGITRELTTSASIVPIDTDDAALYGVPAAIKAVWDTGATMTCIKPALRDRLKLRPLEDSRTEFASVSGKLTAELTLVNLLLMPGLEIENCSVYIMDFPGDADILIGMNIIRMGDFAVCNAGGTTSFSFAIPPFPDRINFEDKAQTANRSSAL